MASDEEDDLVSLRMAALKTLKPKVQPIEQVISVSSGIKRSSQVAPWEDYPASADLVPEFQYQPDPIPEPEAFPAQNRAPSLARHRSAPMQALQSIPHQSSVWRQSHATGMQNHRSLQPPMFPSDNRRSFHQRAPHRSFGDQRGMPFNNRGRYSRRGFLQGGGNSSYRWSDDNAKRGGFFNPRGATLSTPLLQKPLNHDPAGGNLIVVNRAPEVQGGDSNARTFAGRGRGAHTGPSSLSADTRSIRPAGDTRSVRPVSETASSSTSKLELPQDKYHSSPSTAVQARVADTDEKAKPRDKFRRFDDSDSEEEEEEAESDIEGITDEIDRFLNECDEEPIQQEVPSNVPQNKKKPAQEKGGTNEVPAPPRKVESEGGGEEDEDLKDLLSAAESDTESLDLDALATGGIIFEEEETSRERDDKTSSKNLSGDIKDSKVEVKANAAKDTSDKSIVKLSAESDLKKEKAISPLAMKSLPPSSPSSSSDSSNENEAGVAESQVKQKSTEDKDLTTLIDEDQDLDSLLVDENVLELSLHPEKTPAKGESRSPLHLDKYMSKSRSKSPRRQSRRSLSPAHSSARQSAAASPHRRKPSSRQSSVSPRRRRPISPHRPLSPRNRRPSPGRRRSPERPFHTHRSRSPRRHSPPRRRSTSPKYRQRSPKQPLNTTGSVSPHVKRSPGDDTAISAGRARSPSTRGLRRDRDQGRWRRTPPRSGDRDRSSKVAAEFRFNRSPSYERYKKPLEVKPVVRPGGVSPSRGRTENARVKDDPPTKVTRVKDDPLPKVDLEKLSPEERAKIEARQRKFGDSQVSIDPAKKVSLKSIKKRTKKQKKSKEQGDSSPPDNEANDTQEAVPSKKKRKDVGPVEEGESSQVGMLDDESEDSDSGRAWKSKGSRQEQSLRGQRTAEVSRRNRGDSKGVDKSSKHDQGRKSAKDRLGHASAKEFIQKQEAVSDSGGSDEDSHPTSSANRLTSSIVRAKPFKANIPVEDLRLQIHVSNKKAKVKSKVKPDFSAVYSVPAKRHMASDEQSGGEEKEVVVDKKVKKKKKKHSKEKYELLDGDRIIEEIEPEQTEEATETARPSVLDRLGKKVLLDSAEPVEKKKKKKKKHLEDDEPTNELDAKIRKIKKKNAAIARRQLEIEKDRQRYG